MTLTPGKLILDQSPEVLYDSNESPSLDLRFAENKTLDDYVSGTPLVDHQRSMSGSNLSPGTFVNSNGLIETAKVNLTTYSEEFSNPVRSTTTANCSVSAADVAIAPNGELAAEKLIVTAGPAASTTIRGANIPVTIGNVYTASFYVKPDGFRYVGVFEFNSGTGAGYLVFDLDTDTCVNAFNGVTTSQGTSVSVGNGWHRVSYTYTSTGTDNNPRIYIFDSAAGTTATGDGVKGIFVWGAQLEEGSTATTYIPTTNVPSAAPRFDHNPTTGESLGLLVEESRTNFVLNSDTATGSNIGTPLADSLETVTSPRGIAESVRRVERTGSAAGIWRMGQPSGGTPNTTYSASVWVKTANGGSTTFTLDINDFSKTTFTATSEWKRFTVTGGNRPETFRFSDLEFIDSTTEPLYIWGAQLEQGSFATSYIPTAGTALTRNVDVASITGTNFSSWYNQSEGTVFVKGATNDIDGNTGWASFYQASSPNNNRISVRQGPTLITSAGTTIGLSASSSPTPKVIEKISTAYKNDDFALYSTYSTPVLLSAGSVPVSVDTALLGGVEGTGGTFNLNGTIARLTYFPYRLSDVRLQTITS